MEKDTRTEEDLQRAGMGGDSPDANEVRAELAAWAGEEAPAPARIELDPTGGWRIPCGPEDGLQTREPGRNQAATEETWRPLPWTPPARTSLGPWLATALEAAPLPDLAGWVHVDLLAGLRATSD